MKGENPRSTIAVFHETKRLLDTIAKKHDSYDDVIKKLLHDAGVGAKN